MSSLTAFDQAASFDFELAASCVREGSFAVSQEDQLKFYGLYKQATVGPCNVPKPFFFAFEESAKWSRNEKSFFNIKRSAWNSLGAMSSEEAELQYVGLLDTLQPEWRDGVITGGGKKPTWTVFSTMGGNHEV